MYSSFRRIIWIFVYNNVEHTQPHMGDHRLICDVISKLLLQNSASPAPINKCVCSGNQPNTTQPHHRRPLSTHKRFALWIITWTYNWCRVSANCCLHIYIYVGQQVPRNCVPMQHTRFSHHPPKLPIIAEHIFGPWGSFNEWRQLVDCFIN